MHGQTAPFKKIGGSMLPNPPSKAHGFVTCKFPNQKKNIYTAPPPPLPNPGQPLAYTHRDLQDYITNIPIVVM